MGKSQKKRLMRRHNPMRVPDSHLPKGLESAAESSAKKEAVLPIMQKMESPDSSERKWACVAASNLIQNDPSTRRLLQGKNVVGSLITRLSDSEEEVWIEAAGALRNLCIDGGYDICAEMYNKNILAPLKAFVPRISSALSQFIDSPKSLPENARRVVYEFAENVITIFWCLSETSNKALNAINAIGLIPFLMSFLGARDKLPTATVTAAAQSLYVLTDDNWPAIDAIRSDVTYISCLLDIVRVNEQSNETSDDRFVILYVLCCGILGNISPLPPPSSVPNLDVNKDLIFPRLHPVISSVSLDAAVQQVQELVARQANEPLEIEKLSLKHVPKSDHKSSTELELEKLENRLRTVQLALEILTGVYATLPDPVAEAELGKDDGEDIEDGDGDGNMSDPSMEDAMDLDQSSRPVAGDLHTSLSLPSLVRPLLILIQPTALSFPPPSAPSCHPPTTSALSALHVSAFECLNNIFLSLAAHPHSERCADDSAAQTIWSEIWTSLSKVGVDIAVGQEQKQVIWEIAVGVLWGVGKIWKGKLVPTEEHVRILMSICDASTDSQVQVKCIGALECLAQHPNSLDANWVISSYLLNILLPTSTSPSPKGTEPLIQAVSALIDIYSDESLPYDVNFREGKFEDRLAQSVEGLRKAVRAINRKTETDLKLRGEEVRDNLIAFIKYRKELRF